MQRRPARRCSGAAMPQQPRQQKLQMDLHALQQEAEQARQQAATAMQEADAQVNCKGQPGSLGHKDLVMSQSLANCCVHHTVRSQQPAAFGP